MKVSVEKPGSPEELVHFGKKGMKWGVRNRTSSAVSNVKGMSTKKKVAIGVGVAAVIGAAYVAHRLSQGSQLPVLKVGKAATGKSGQLYVSNLTHKQWDLKIKDQIASAKRMSDASKSIAARRRSGAPGWLP